MRFIKFAGWLTMKLIKTEISYIGANDEDEYFAGINPDHSLIFSGTHRGKYRGHDPTAFVRAVTGSKHLMERVPNAKVWASVKYFMDWKTRRPLEYLGGIAIPRSGDYPAFDCHPTEEEIEEIRLEYLQRTYDFVNDTEGKPANALGILPGGVRGNEKLRAGVGLIMEHATQATMVPVAATSRTEKTSNIPRDLKLVFARPISTDQGLSADEYVQQLEKNYQEALESVGAPSL